LVVPLLLILILLKVSEDPAAVCPVDSEGSLAWPQEKSDWLRRLPVSVAAAGYAVSVLAEAVGVVAAFADHWN
jgi:hypothetical protein